MMPRQRVTMYTDGSSSRKTTCGGWGALLEFPGGRTKELSGGEPWTTNNRMEMTAAIRGLRAVKKSSRVRIVTDSQYLMKGATQWIHAWRLNSWRSTTGEVKNRDLWEVLMFEIGRHEVSWEWVKGHTGVPGNECVDRLAGEARKEIEVAWKDRIKASDEIPF